MFAIPPIKWRRVKNALATNHLLFIEQRPGLPFGAAILAEEVAEWNVKAWPAFGAGVAAFAGIGYAASALGAFYAVLAALVAGVGAAVIVNNIISSTRRIEYWGNAVNWRAGVRLGADSASYLAAQARGLSGYGQFRHSVPVDAIIIEITERQVAADKWLDKHWAQVLVVYKKGRP